MTVALVGALATIAAAYIFKETKTGLRVRASREDEIAARAIGVNLARDRGIAFVLSAFFVGLGGFLYAQFLGVFNPEAFYLNITFIVIAMLVVGGTKSVAGAVVGPVAVSVLTYGLRQVERGADLGVVRVPARPGLQEVGLALAMLLILWFRPRGITGGNEITWPRRAWPGPTRRPSPPAPEHAEDAPGPEADSRSARPPPPTSDRSRSAGRSPGRVTRPGCLAPEPVSCQTASISPAARSETSRRICTRSPRYSTRAASNGRTAGTRAPILRAPHEEHRRAMRDAEAVRLELARTGWSRSSRSSASARSRGRRARDPRGSARPSAATDSSQPTSARRKNE